MRLFRQSLLALLTVCTAFVAVGLTAPSGSPFSIAVKPVLWRIDAAAIAEARASALGLDVDIKLGTMHMHVGWSAFPLSSPAPARSPAAER